MAPAIDARFAIASVRAPLTTDEGGYTWSESRSPGRYDSQSLRTTLTWFREWLDGLASARPEAQDIYLLGFSAGMAMAGALTLDEPERYAGVVLLSGTLPFETDVPFTKDRLKGVPIYHGHGSFDRVIPADLVARTAKFLRETGGAALTSRTFPIAHEISETEIVDVNATLTRWMES